MTRRERDQLVAAAATAWRPRDVDGSLRQHPAWHDLDEAGRADAFDAAADLRAIEAALDPSGLSATSRAVLGRIRRA